jgi:putative transposase
MQTPTKATSHSVYNLNYHIVFVTKYRNKVLSGAIEEHIKEQMPILCERYEWEQLALEVMPDHVHLFVSAPPTTAPVTITKTLKSILAVSIFKTFPTLKQKRFWGSGLWSDGCYYGSAGTVSAKTIAMYIENQKSQGNASD